MACGEPIPDTALSLLNILIWLLGATLSASFYGQLGPFKVRPIYVHVCIGRWVCSDPSRYVYGYEEDIRLVK